MWIRGTGRGAELVFCTSILVVSPSCGGDSDGQESGRDPVEASAGKGALKASGAVSRIIGLSEMGDGLGTVYVSLDVDCRNDRGTATKPLASFEIKDADLRKTNAELPFVIMGLEEGKTYYAAAWFDDVDNPEQDEVLPGKGDLAMFGDLSPRCVKVEMQKADVENVKLELDYEMMFTLPGFESDSGVMSGTDEVVDPTTIVDDGSKHTVTIHLSRSVEPGMGGDGKGRLFSGLSAECFSDTTGETPVPTVALLRDSVELAKIDTPVDLVIENVPNGVYQFNGFIDDVASSDAKNPRPGKGDLVSFGGLGPACTQVVVNGKDVDADFDLNFVMSFDL